MKYLLKQQSNKNTELKIIKQNYKNGFKMNLVKNGKLLYIIYSAVSWDVAQRSFSKYTAKQMSFESGFNVSAHLISSGTWFIITKSGLLLFRVNS